MVMVLPFAGSALATFTALSMIGRIAGIVSYQGGVAMSAYELAKNEGNPVLAVFFLCVSLVPGVGKSVSGTFRDGAVLRGSMTADNYKNLGPITRTALTRIDTVRKICSR